MGKPIVSVEVDRETLRGLIAVAEWAGRRLLAAANEGRLELGGAPGRIPAEHPAALAVTVAAAREEVAQALLPVRAEPGTVAVRHDLAEEIRAAALEAQALAQTFVWRRAHQRFLAAQSEGSDDR